jgi:death-on-curing protein
VDDLLAAATAALGGRQPEVRDVGLLESAAHRPQDSVFGEDAYPTIDAKAAALLHSLVATMPSSTATSASPGWRCACSTG